MSAIAEAIIDICAQSERRYGFKIARLAITQEAFNQLRAETDWCKELARKANGVLLFNGVEVVVSGA